MTRDQYQTVKEIADCLKVSETTVRGWIKGGELRAIEIGKGWRIPDRDPDTFLCSHATPSRVVPGSDHGSETGRERGA
ncbi:helix-turn-helix domain-containing protein [Aurantimonas sp. A2-1-M11]|uniref:helix-turn-helix domain-containing protein n=1 Tax=Aurantimonas sp. A2-1-M11 TaxID=3113712 RepID=UPI002F94C891